MTTPCPNSSPSAVRRGAPWMLENLTAIRQRAKATRNTATKRRLHSWSFAQLKHLSCVQGRGARLYGGRGGTAHTSQTCSRCGHQARNNRRFRSRFVCRACGFALHADLNAARNVAAKYRTSRGISPTSAPLSTGVLSPPRCSVRQHASPEARDKLPALAGSR